MNNNPGCKKPPVRKHDNLEDVIKCNDFCSNQHYCMGEFLLYDLSNGLFYSLEFNDMKEYLEETTYEDAFKKLNIYEKFKTQLNSLDSDENFLYQIKKEEEDCLLMLVEIQKRNTEGKIYH